MKFYIVYSLFSLVPLWFIIYALARIRHHYKDGSDRMLRRSCYFYAKLVSVLTLFVITLLHLIEVISLGIETEYDIFESSIIAFYLFLSMLGWVFSFILLLFEYKKKLQMKWLGHRCFWVFNWVLYAIVITSMILSSSTIYQMEIRYATYALGAIVVTLLMYFAVFRPNEFPIERVEVHSLLSVPFKSSILQSQERIEISVKIRDFKVKVQGNKSIPFFNIIVRIQDETYQVRRSYQEFDKIHRSLRKLFPGEEFPYLNFPEFPLFKNNESIDRRMRDLEQYLNGVIQHWEYMSEEAIEFLKVPSPYAEEFLSNHKSFVEVNRCFSAKDEGIINTRGSYAVVYTDLQNESMPDMEEEFFSPNLQTFVQVSIPRWHTTEDGTTIFQLEWKVSNTDCRGYRDCRFKGFQALHQKLKKAVHPAKLPCFPRKNYLQNFKQMNTQAIEKRRDGLERYMANVLNDPAFLSEPLLKFLGCSLTVEEVWARRTEAFNYLLTPSSSWETEIEKDSFYQKYSFPICKLFKGNKICEWVFSRRFSEFYTLNNFLLKRATSPVLGKYMSFLTAKKGYIEPPALPDFLNKPLIPLANSEQIEDRLHKLEIYLSELLRLKSVRTCYYFRGFIKEPTSS